MRVSIPGVPGVYYDTDAGTTAIATLMSTAGRRAPKPKGYAIQVLPYLWSFDVDLHEVPNDHPIQYLHPESATSLGEVSTERRTRQAGTELESVLRFAWSVNREVESATNSLLGHAPTQDGITIEIQDGSIVADGEELETDEFDVDDRTTDTEFGSDERTTDTGVGPDDEPGADDSGVDSDDEFEPDTLGDDSDDDTDTDRSDTGTER